MRPRGVLIVLACCVALTGCSGSGDNGRQSTGQNKSRPVDAMVDVGGRKLHLQCDGSGSPTVILEAGLTGDHRTWDGLFNKVASSTRVCAYDRANIDPSDPAPTPRSARDMVADLHTLLRKAHEDGPYLLVGFSFGGLISQLYASTYPDDTAGLVLVESNHPDEEDQFEAKLTKAQIAADHKDAESNPEGVDVFRSFKEVQAAPAVPDRPLVVVTAGQPAEWPPGWDAKVFDGLRAAEQKDLVSLSSHGTQLIARKSGHEVPLSEPDVVVKGIEIVLAKAR
jgi:pimeloyl-ACP methyl ester carboxylesterase